MSWEDILKIKRLHPKKLDKVVDDFFNRHIFGEDDYNETKLEELKENRYDVDELKDYILDISYLDEDEAYYLDVNIDDGEPIPEYNVAYYKFDKKGKLTRKYLASDYYSPYTSQFHMRGDLE